MSQLTRHGWALMLLRRGGFPTNLGNALALVAWCHGEGCQARWNPLATTWRMPGSAPFNSAGVQHYATVEDGLDATLNTLRRGEERYGYGPILEALAEASDAERTFKAAMASSWGTGVAGYDPLPFVAAVRRAWGDISQVHVAG
jgi:hypothetical protein